MSARSFIISFVCERPIDYNLLVTIFEGVYKSKTVTSNVATSQYTGVVPSEKMIDAMLHLTLSAMSGSITLYSVDRNKNGV